MTPWGQKAIEDVARAILNEMQNKPPEAIIMGARREGKTYGMAEMYAHAAILAYNAALLREPLSPHVLDAGGNELERQYRESSWEEARDVAEEADLGTILRAMLTRADEEIRS